MAQNYTRQSSLSDGDTITASLFNDEYNQLVNAFTYSSTSASSTGHRHDGSAGQGGNIFKIGDLDFFNKIEVDSTNNRWGFYVEVSSAAVEQIRIQDGAVVPVTTNDIDLGTSSLQFKDLYIDGTANVDSLTLTSGATVTTILDEDDLSSDSNTALVTQQSIKAYVDAQVTAQDLDFQADTGGALSIDLDSETMTFTGGTGIDTSGSGNAVTFAIDSTVATLAGTQTLTNKTLTSPDINTPDIDGGTIDGTVIGGSTAAAGSFTTGSFTGNVSFGDNNKAIFGAGSDLEIYHDGSGSFIADNGTGDLHIRASNTLRLQNAAGQLYAFGFNGGEFALYHNNSQKLATTSTGIDVTGSVAINSSATSASTTNQLTLRGGTGNVVSGDVVGGINFDSFDLGNQNTSASISAIASGSHVSGSTLDTDLNFKTADGSSPVSRLNIAANGDISFYEDTGTTTKLTWDASAESLNFADNGKAIFGASNDLQIYHNGSNSFIDDAGTGDLYLRGSGAVRIGGYASETAAIFNHNGSVELRYDNAQKLATTSTGINVTGTVTAADLTLSDSVPQISLTDSDGTDQISKIFRSGANLIIRSRNNTDYGTTIIQRDNGTVQNASVARFDASGDISFYEDTGTTAKLTWDASAESLNFADNGKAVFGASNDLSVYHDGSDSYIHETGTGSLKILGQGRITLKNSAGDETLADFLTNDRVDLYYDNSVKFTTTATGIDVIGTVSADGLDVSSATGSSVVTPTEAKISSSTSASDWSTSSAWGVLGFYSADTSGGGAGNRAQISTNMEVATGAYSSLDFTLANPGNAYAQDSWLKLQNSASSAERKVIVSAEGGLDVTGSVVSDGLTVDGGTSNQPVLIKSTDATAKLGFQDDTTTNTYSVTVGAVGDEMILSSGSGGGEAVRIDSSGNVGIGTTSPAYRLGVQTTTTNIAQFDTTGTTAGLITFSDANTASSNTVRLGSIGNDLAFYTNTAGAGAERMRIDSAGNVGIGTSGPSDLLDISANGTSAMRLSDSSSPATYAQITQANGVLSFNADAGGAQSNSVMKFLVDNSEACLLYTSPSPRDGLLSRMPSSA